jgi:hypothetical protein
MRGHTISKNAARDNSGGEERRESEGMWDFIPRKG